MCDESQSLRSSLASSHVTNRPPSAPTPPPNPTPPNQPPQIVVGSVTPTLGIVTVTTFTAPIEARDPDGDQFVLTATGCSFARDTRIDLENGRATLSFKADRTCGSSISLTATDARGAVAQATIPFQRTSLEGPFRLVLGEGFYAQPNFYVNLRQSETLVTGTIRDQRSHEGVTDPAQPGVVDGIGSFRLRFKIESGEDLVLAGQVVSAADRGCCKDVLVASGQVVGARFAGRTFQFWYESSYGIERRRDKSITP